MNMKKITCCIFFVWIYFKESRADLHNQSLKPFWLVYGFNKHNFGGEHHSTIWTKFSFIPSSGSEEENFQFSINQ